MAALGQEKEQLLAASQPQAAASRANLEVDCYKHGLGYTITQIDAENLVDGLEGTHFRF